MAVLASNGKGEFCLLFFPIIINSKRPVSNSQDGQTKTFLCDVGFPSSFEGPPHPTPEVVTGYES